MPEPLGVTSLRVCLKSTHCAIKLYLVGIFQRTHKNSQCNSILPRTLKELTKYVTRYILITWWVLFKQTLKEVTPSGSGIYYKCIARWFLKETKGFFHKVSARYFLVWIVKGIKGFAHNSTNIYPSGSWWVLPECIHLDDQLVSGWVLCKNTQHVPGGYFGGQSVGKM